MLLECENIDKLVMIDVHRLCEKKELNGIPNRSNSIVSEQYSEQEEMSSRSTTL